LAAVSPHAVARALPKRRPAATIASFATPRRMPKGTKRRTTHADEQIQQQRCVQVGHGGRLDRGPEPQLPIRRSRFPRP
jgi:hypothetical protein